MFKKKEKQPKYIKSPLNNDMINYAVYYMSFGESILYSLVLFGLGGVAGLLFYGGLFKSNGQATIMTIISNVFVVLVVGLLANFIFKPMLVAGLKNKRDKMIRKQFSDMLESLSAALSAGLTFHDAVVNAKKDLLNQYTEKDYMVIEINEILLGIQNGLNLEDMISNLGERSGIEDISNFANVISNCYKLGGDFKHVVRKSKDIISDKVAIEEEIQTKLESNKLQLNVMSLMPIMVVGIMKVMSPDFAQSLESVIGVICTSIAVAIFVFAYLWGKKIVEVK